MPLSRRQIIHNFYTFLTSFTLLFTLIFVSYIPLYVESGGLVIFPLFLTVVYFSYLRRTDPFQCAVISKEMPKVPLYIFIGVILLSLGYTVFATLVQIQVMLNSHQVALMAEALESQGNSIPLNPPEKDIEIHTPLENSDEHPLERQGLFLRTTKSLLQNSLNGVIDKYMESPTTPEVAELERQLAREFTAAESSSAVHPSQLRINMGGNAVVITPVKIQEGDESINAIACCLDKKKSSEMAAMSAPSGNGPVGFLYKQASRIVLTNQESCVCLNKDADNNWSIVGGNLTIAQNNVEVDSPRSPSNMDLQADRLSGEQIT